MVEAKSADVLVSRSFPRVPQLVSLVRSLLMNSLVWNSTCIMATTVLTSALGYGYWIVAAHTYPTHDVGLASALLSAMQFTSTLANLGIGSFLIQTLPRRAAGREWSQSVNAGLVTGVSASLIAGGVVVLLLPRLSPQFSVGNVSLVLAVFAAGVALTTLSTVLDQIFVAERASGNMLIRNAVFAALKIPLLVLPFAFIHIGALGILLSWIAAAAVTVVLSLLILVPRLGRHYRPSLHGILADIRTMRASLLGQHLINIGGVAPMYVIPILVTVRVSATDSAYYYTTWMLGSVFFMISSSVATALFSEGSHAIGHLAGKVRSSIKLIAALLVPMMIIFLVGGRAILGVFGPGYAQHSVPLLDILVLAAIPDAITNIFVSTLRVRGRVRHAALLNLGMAALALLLAWLLLPRMGIAGGGLAWMIGQTAGCVVVLVVLLRIPLAAYRKRRDAQVPFFSDASDESPFGDYVTMRDAVRTSEHIAIVNGEHAVMGSANGVRAQRDASGVETPDTDIQVGDITLIRKKPSGPRNAQPNELAVGVPTSTIRNYVQPDSDPAWGDLAETLVMRAVKRS